MLLILTVKLQPIQQVPAGSRRKTRRHDQHGTARAFLAPQHSLAVSLYMDDKRFNVGTVDTVHVSFRRRSQLSLPSTE